MQLHRSAWIGLAVLALASLAAAQDFNVDVGELGSAPPPGYSAAGRTGVWNSVRADHVTPFTTGPTAQDVMLVDVDGNPTGVGFHQYGGMDLVTTSDPSVTGNAGVLMNDYLATHSATLESCMYLNGLENGTYEVLTYAWMPNSPSTQQLVRFDFVPGSTLVGGTWTGHAEGVTYSRTVITISNGHIGWHVGIPSGGALNPGAAFNGFQVRRLDTGAVPAMPAWAAIGLALCLASAGAWTVKRGTGTVRAR